MALVLGTMAAFAVARYRFFGKEAISILIVLPIALPGIVTGIALSNAITTTLAPVGINFGLFTVVVGHATFCVVVVYNNVLARLRRTGGSLEEASMDLGAGVFQTFRHVTFPAIRSALLAGAHPGLRAVLRRDHRHDVHRRRERADPAAVDLQQPGPAQPGAGGRPSSPRC